jgi:hypothetical protein
LNSNYPLAQRRSFISGRVSRRNQVKKIYTIALGAVAVAAANPAAADIQFFVGNVPGSLDTVQLSGGALDATVTGTVGSGNTALVFTGAENIISPSNGQARIEAADGALNFLRIEPLAGLSGFTAFEANLNAGATGTATILVYDQFGVNPASTFTVATGGQNFFNLRSINGQVITRVEVSTPTNVPLQDVRQVRIGGVTTFAVVPEPSAWALMIMGFGGVGALLRRRNARFLLAQA